MVQIGNSRLYVFQSQYYGFADVNKDGQTTLAEYVGRSNKNNQQVDTFEEVADGAKYFDPAFYRATNPDAAGFAENTAYQRMYSKSLNINGKRLSEADLIVRLGRSSKQSDSQINAEIAETLQEFKAEALETHYEATLANGERRAPNQFFDEQYYLQTNPDVANAVASGQYKSGLEHYLAKGSQEKRAVSSAQQQLMPAFGYRTRSETIANNMYETILGRTPGSSEAYNSGRALETQFDSVASYTKMFINSAEYQAQNKNSTQKATDLYQAMLGREPDAGGLAGAKQFLDTGGSMNSLVDSIANSPEYWQRLQAMRTQDLGEWKGAID